MINRLTIFGIVLALLVLPVYGEALQGGNYDLQPMDGYGSGILEGGDYKLKDVKGAPFAGFVTGGDDDLYIGPIYILTPSDEVTEGVTEEGTEEAPAGTIPLDIERDGDTTSDTITISWDPVYQNAQLYVLTGDGTGQYSNAGNWETLADFAANNAGVVDDPNNVNDGEIVLSGQVGSGFAELYVKGIQEGFNANDLHPDYQNNETYLMVAWAVGKFDMPVFKSASSIKYTRFSLPLEQTSADFADIIGDQLTADSSPGEADQILQWTGSGWNSLYYKSQADGWLLNAGSDFNFTFGEGFALRVPIRENQADSVITLVGDVKHDAFAIADTYQDLAINRYTIFAQPYPIFMTLDNAGFYSSGAYSNDTPASADQILKWDGASWNSMYLTGSGTWSLLTGASYDFTPAIGYTYRKGDGNTGSGYNWQLNPY